MPRVAAGAGGVNGVLGEDHRIVVGEGNATAAEPQGGMRRSPRATAASASRSNSRALLMSQFWQNWQPRLQPAVPNDSTLVPG